MKIELTEPLLEDVNIEVKEQKNLLSLPNDQLSQISEFLSLGDIERFMRLNKDFYKKGPFLHILQSYPTLILWRCWDKGYYDSPAMEEKQRRFKSNEIRRCALFTGLNEEKKSEEKKLELKKTPRSTQERELEKFIAKFGEGQIKQWGLEIKKMKEWSNRLKDINRQREKELLPPYSFSNLLKTCGSWSNFRSLQRMYPSSSTRDRAAFLCLKYMSLITEIILAALIANCYCCNSSCDADGLSIGAGVLTLIILMLFSVITYERTKSLYSDLTEIIPRLLTHKANRLIKEINAAEAKFLERQAPSSCSFL